MPTKDSSGSGRVLGGLAACFGVCLGLKLVILFGGFAVVLGNPYVIAAAVVLVAGAVAALIVRHKRGDTGEADEVPAEPVPARRSPPTDDG